MSHRSIRWIARACVGVAAFVSGAASAADVPADRPDAVPYRPTVSTPAALSAPGWIEAEFGGLYLDDRHADDGPSRRSSVPYTLKYAFSEDWGIRIGGEAYVHANFVDGTRVVGFGDTGVVLKRRFAVDDASAFGLELGVLSPTAKRGLETGSGKPDWSLNAIYSADIGAWHTDINLVDTRFGSRREDASRLQTLGAFSLSRPLTDKWTVAGEISGTHQHRAPGTAQALAALSYTLRRDVVLDFGAAHGLNRTTPTWQAFTGVTISLVHL